MARAMKAGLQLKRLAWIFQFQLHGSTPMGCSHANHEFVNSLHIQGGCHIVHNRNTSYQEVSIFPAAYGKAAFMQAVFCAFAILFRSLLQNS